MEKIAQLAMHTELYFQRPGLVRTFYYGSTALFRARRYALETLKLLAPSVDPILIDQVVDAMPSLGSIHPHQSQLVT